MSRSPGPHTATMRSVWAASAGRAPRRKVAAASRRGPMARDSGGSEMSNKILTAIDGSEHAWKALDLATDIAKQRGRGWSSCTSCRTSRCPRRCGPSPRPSTSRWRRRRPLPLGPGDGRPLTRAAETRARGRGLGDVVGRTVEGKPADQILEEAAGEEVEMIVMGSRGLSDTRRCSSAASPTRSPTTPAAPASRSSERPGNGPTPPPRSDHSSAPAARRLSDPHRPTSNNLSPD